MALSKCKVGFQDRSEFQSTLALETISQSQTRESSILPTTLFLCFLCDGHEHNETPHSSERCYDNIRGVGYKRHHFIALSLFSWKVISNTKMQIRSSCSKEWHKITFQPYFWNIKIKLRVITRFGVCHFWTERDFRFQRNKLCFTGSWKNKETK